MDTTRRSYKMIRKSQESFEVAKNKYKSIHNLNNVVDEKNSEVNGNQSISLYCDGNFLKRSPVTLEGNIEKEKFTTVPMKNRLCNCPLSPIKLTSPKIIDQEKKLPQEYHTIGTSKHDLESGNFDENIILSEVTDLNENGNFMDANSDTDDDTPYYDSDADPTYNPNLSQRELHHIKNLFPPQTRSSTSDSSKSRTDISPDVSILKNEEKSLDKSASFQAGMNTTQLEGLHAKSLNLEVIPTEDVQNTQVKKKYKRKPDLCYFCETEVCDFARHVTRNHSQETEVQKILSLPPGNKERRTLLNLLRKRGNYLKNSVQLFKPVRSSTNPTRNLLPCTSCLGFFSAKLLYRHRKTCDGSKGNAQSEGQNLLVSFRKIDKRLKEEIFPHMRADRISLEAKRDKIICAFGARYLKIHREKHLVSVASRKMRELSRVLLEVKKLEPSIKNLFEALQPKHFDLFIKATKIIAKYDEVNEIFGSPTLAMNIATTLKQCCDIALTLVLKGEIFNVASANIEAKIKNMITLFETNWRYEISSQAANNLNIKKWNKLTIVPLASDLKIMKHYLHRTAVKAIETIKNKRDDVKAYTILLETIYCRIILLNRKRPGELQRITLHTYLSATNEKKGYEEFNAVISPTEQILLNKIKRIIIRGKRGRGVPVLFTTDIQEHLNILIQHRQHFFEEQNPYLFGKPFKMTPISGYKVLNKHANASGAKHPSALTATRLRKHLATLSQLLIMNENEIDQLANFMGHTIGVHKNSYRLPDDIYQTAKLSKLLLLMEKGSVKEYKGKHLDDIEINMDEDVLNDTCAENDSESECDSEELNSDSFRDIRDSQSSTSTNVDPNIVKKKRVLTAWTEIQKEKAKSFFAGHIQNKQPPKRRECEELINQNKEIFCNKSWLKIKVFIQNEYRKIKS